MNKELIKHFEDLPYVSISQMGKKSFIDVFHLVHNMCPGFWVHIKNGRAFFIAVFLL